MVVATPFLADDGFTVTFQGMTATQLKALKVALIEASDAMLDDDPIQEVAGNFVLAITRMEEHELAAVE